MDRYDDLIVDVVVGGPLDNNTYIIYDANKNACIVDPSMDFEIIVKFIEENKLNVSTMLITHGHYDHIFTAEKIKEKYNTLIYASKKEREFMIDSGFNKSFYFSGKSITLKADVYLDDYEEFTVLNSKVINIDTPGHTPGSSCFLFVKEKFLLSGDTLFKRDYGRCDLAGGNHEQMKHSLTKKLFQLDDDIVVYPGHYDKTTIVEEKKNNLINKYM